MQGKIPIIYFTAEDNIEQLAKEAGADAYFRKSFETAALLEMARKFVA